MKNNNKERLTLILRLVLFVLPFFIGLMGFMSIEGESPLWAAYHAVRLYTLNTDINNLNTLIEIARWMAPVAMCTTLVMLFKSLWTRIKYHFVAVKKNSVSVYGDNCDSQVLLQKLGSRGIAGDLNKPLPSRYHILLTHDNSGAAEFFERFAGKLPKKSQILVCLDGISPMSLQQKRISAFSIEENSASDYWKRFPAKIGEKIAVIGDGSLLDTMLSKALLVNIYSENQGIEYHVWDSSDMFLSGRFMAQTAAEFAGDKLIEHHGSFYNDIKLLNGIDRIILCLKEKDNLSVASRLKELCSNVKIYIYNRNATAVTAFFENSVICFGEAEKVLEPEIIIREELTEAAKRLNALYCENYGGSEWEDLSVFFRQSNISAVEYFPVLRKLHEQGRSYEELIRLEHIRWCRFYFLNNWRYGKERDNNARIHPCLIPFDQLSNEEQEKDAENVRIALNNRFYQ